MSPLISVIMPCYNRGNTISKSIESVLAQTFTNWELVIVDDGSTDNSQQVIRHFNDPRIVLYSQKNGGVCAARNAGLRFASGEMIAFLDADDTWDYECLKKLHHALCNSVASIAYCGWKNVGLPGGQGEPFIPPDYETSEKTVLLFENCRWPIHACLTQKKAIIDAGMFNESIQTSEDYLLWLKIGISHPIARVPEVLAYYHFHDGIQATQDKAAIAINHYRTQDMFLKQHPAIKKKLGHKAIRQSMHGELLKRGFECYWKRDMHSARKIFRLVMRKGYGKLKDWQYMLPSLLPYKIHRGIIRLYE